MPTIIQGNGGTNAEVEPGTRALRTVIRPNDYGALGIYSKALTSGVMAAGLAANASVFQFRWGSATNICLVKKVLLSAGGIAAFTAGSLTFNMVPARAFTINGAGGTAGTLTGNNGKMRTSMATTLLSDVRVASTAALTAGTWTLDTDAIGSFSGSTTITAGTGLVPPGTELFKHTIGEYPFALVQNEGFHINATVPATGTWTFSVQVEWEELASF